MGGFLALVGSLGMGVIVASIIYQVLTHPKGSAPILSTAKKITNSTTSTLFK